MADHEAFIRTITAAPDDDTPRLVYADFLEENGDPARAELIRVQCELARTRWPADDTALRRREGELLGEHGPRWLAELPQAEGLEWAGPPDRGFYDFVTVKGPEVLRRHGDRIRATSPVTWLRVEYQRGLADVAGLPFLADVTDLTADNRAGDRPGPEALARSAYAAALRSIDLGSSAVGTDGFLRLLTSPCLPALEVFGLRSAAVHGDGLQVLPSADVIPRVRYLDLSLNAIGDAGVRALAACRAFAGIEHVNFFRAGVGDGAAVALAAARHLRSLRFLGLEETGVTDAGAWALGQARHLRSLRRLYLPAGVSDGAAGRLRRTLPHTVIDVCGRETAE